AFVAPHVGAGGGAPQPLTRAARRVRTVAERGQRLPLADRAPTPGRRGGAARAHRGGEAPGLPDAQRDARALPAPAALRARRVRPRTFPGRPPEGVLAAP